MKRNIILITIYLIISSYALAGVKLPEPKVKVILDTIIIPRTTNIRIHRNIKSNLSLAMNRTEKNFKEFNKSASSTPSFIVQFCQLQQLNTCHDSNQYNWMSNRLKELKIDDEYALLPILDKKTNKIVGISLAANTIKGWQYAVDWLIKSYNMKKSTYQASFIHDYPTFTDRAIFAADNNPSLDYWKNRIDVAATLRVKELSFSLVTNRKININSINLSKYSKQLFNTNSTFYTDTALANKVLRYGKLRGVDIIPTIPHASSLQLNKYYPSWMMPNGRAINWKLKESRQFLKELIFTAGSFEGVEKISIWADEGGIIDRQKYFIDEIKNSFNLFQKKTGKKLSLRLMLSPVVSQAIRSNKITNLLSALPQNTTIDFYSGVSYLNQSGTYHIKTPTLWNDVINKISNKPSELNLTGVGFAIRSQFNKVEFPYPQYINSFIDEIRKYSGKGEYIYLGGDYKALDEVAVEYISHRLWSGLGSTLSLANDANWELKNPKLSMAWEDLMQTTFLSSSQRFLLRRNPKNPEADKNFKQFISQAQTGENIRWINLLNTKISVLEKALTNNPTSNALSIENIQISLLISKTLLEIRKLVQNHSLTETQKDVNNSVSNQIKTNLNKINNYCNETKRYKKRWKTLDRTPHCAYLPYLNKQ